MYNVAEVFMSRADIGEDSILTKGATGSDVDKGNYFESVNSVLLTVSCKNYRTL